MKDSHFIHRDALYTITQKRGILNLMFEKLTIQVGVVPIPHSIKG